MCHTFGEKGTDLFCCNVKGGEPDMTAKYKLFKNFGVVAGYSHFWAGDWLDDTSNGGDQTGVDWFYLQSTVKF
jgi:hypothetical protein